MAISINSFQVVCHVMNTKDSSGSQKQNQYQHQKTSANKAKGAHVRWLAGVVRAQSAFAFQSYGDVIEVLSSEGPRF